jgi:outer membrane protein assembly factor BamB
VSTRRLLTLGAAGSAIVLTGALNAYNPEAEKYWPQWRGPSATGVSKHATPPLEWSETKNVRWKKEIPGSGSGTPVIWGDKLFILAAVPMPATTPDAGLRLVSQQRRDPAAPPAIHRYTIMALDRRDGKVIWERVAREEAPHEGTHQQFGTFASPSAVTDGEVVVASFESRGIYAYDMNGKLLWQKDLGDKSMRNQFGEGSTPALYGNSVVVVWDHQGDSFIVAFDKKTGNERWRAERKEIDSWATPLVVEHGGRAQVVTAGTNQVRSYDLETGKLLWFGEGLTANPIPSPVAIEGLVILTSGFRGNDLQAVKLAEAKDDITKSPAIAWTLERDTPYVPSPLLYDGILYLLKGNTGVLSTFDGKTGQPHYQLQRLDATPNVFASPVGAAGRVYVAGQEGTTAVLKAGPTFEVLATNKLDDGFNASPALVDNALYLRGKRFLYCIAEK